MTGCAAGSLRGGTRALPTSAGRWGVRGEGPGDGRAEGGLHACSGRAFPACDRDVPVCAQTGTFIYGCSFSLVARIWGIQDRRERVTFNLQPGNDLVGAAFSHLRALLAWAKIFTHLGWDVTVTNAVVTVQKEHGF